MKKPRAGWQTRHNISPKSFKLAVPPGSSRAVFAAMDTNGVSPPASRKEANHAPNDFSDGNYSKQGHRLEKSPLRFFVKQSLGKE